MTNTTSHSTNEQPGCTNPQMKENAMSIRTLITTSLVLAFGFGFFLAPAPALAIFGQDPDGDNLPDPEPRPLPLPPFPPTPPSRPEIKKILTAEMIFPEEHAWATNWPKIVKAWRHWKGELKKHEAQLLRSRFGSARQRELQRLIRRDKAALKRLAEIAKRVRWYNTIKNKKTVVHLRGRYANDDTLRRIVAELQSRQRPFGVSICLSD
jgi:hypothetical protein